MASSIIDALLPSAPRPSAGDSPGHGSDGAPFAPVLSEALRADDAHSTATPSACDDLADAAANDDYRLGDHTGDEGAELHAGAEAVQDEQATEEAVHDDRDDDEVEISEEAATAEAALATAAQSQSAAKEEPATTGDDAAQEAAAIHDVPTAAEAESDHAAGANAPADKKEFGDLFGATRHDAAAKSKQASESEAKGAAKDNKSKAVEGKSAKTPSRDVTVKDGAAVANDEAAVDDGDDATDASLIGKSKVAGANNSSHAGEEGHDPSGNTASQDDKRPTTTASSAATAIAEPEVAPVATTAAGSISPTPTPSSTDLAAVAPVTADVAAPTTAPRGGAALAKLAAERSIHATAAANGDDGASGVDRARFVSRVEGAIRSAHQRDGRVQVRLSPPELGALKIELKMHDGALSAHVEAETTSARKLLLDNLPALRDRLEQQGVRVERFDVDVRQEGGNGGTAQERSDDRAARETDRQRSAGRRENSTPTAAKSSRGARPGRTTADAELDVTV